MCVDDTGVYVGHTSGVLKMDRSSGKTVWNIEKTEGILAGDTVSEVSSK